VVDGIPWATSETDKSAPVIVIDVAVPSVAPTTDGDGATKPYPLPSPSGTCDDSADVKTLKRFNAAILSAAVPPAARGSKSTAPTRFQLEPIPTLCNVRTALSACISLSL
jgi:hypothetical protein